MKMEENSESLKIVKKRWNWLRKNIGRSIIDFFQMKDQKREAESKIEDDDQIELLLLEAGAYGLRIEVEQWAMQELKEDPNLSRLEAYVLAYNEWIK